MSKWNFLGDSYAEDMPQKGWYPRIPSETQVAIVYNTVGSPPY